MPRIQIDADDLETAYEGGFDDMTWYLDRETGKLISWLDEWEDFEDDETAEFAAALEQDEAGERYLLVPARDSREGYRIMEDFAAGVEDGRVRQALFDALDRRRPFASFKEELARHGALRDRWYEYNSARVRRAAAEWLESEGVDFELVERRVED